jgi:LacI family transcriptional regulator, galactose operon repressor
MAVTLRDVAQQAGVSIKTVSRVVNNEADISKETRQRVSAVIAELGYRPSKLARALVTHHTDTIGLIVGDIANPFFAEVAHGVLAAARDLGYELFLRSSDYQPQQEIDALYALADHNVDGMIIFPDWDNRAELEAFASQHMPLVVVDRAFPPHPRIGLVLNDIRGGAQRAVEYLVGKGHRAIGMLAGRTGPRHQEERLQGFRQALLAHRLPVVGEWILTGSPNGEVGLARGYAAAHQLLTQHPQVTAAFAYDDLIAIGALQAGLELGRRVPDDFAIVGFDDISFASSTNPPLTTVRIDKVALGQQAVIRLVEMLNNPLGQSDSPWAPIHLDVELVVRRSA